MEDLIGLIILLIAYRTFKDRKRGRARSSAEQKTSEASVLLEQLFSLDEEEEERLAVDLEEQEELSEEIPEEQLVPEAVVESHIKQVPKAVLAVKRPLLTGVNLKQAVIWSEILQKPKALRRR